MNDFGSVLINNTSAAASFTVTNTGQATSGQITPVITGTNAGDFTATNGCTTLAGAGTCIITVTFHPTTAGTKSASLVVSGSPGGTVMAALLGTGQIPGTLVINPASLAFGNVTVGSTGTQQTFTITNQGSVATSTMTVTKAGADPADFTKVSDTCNGQTLAAAATCTVVVNFAPTSAGAKNASFVVSATTGGSVNGSTTGTGIAPANLNLNPSLQDFGTVALGSSSSNVTFTVTNVGGVTSSAIGRSVTGDYSIVNDNCNGTTLAPAANCNIIVRFTPTATGTRAGTLDITATTGGNRTATLTGTGVAVGSIIIGPSPFPFPNTTTGQTSTSQIFTVTNTGGSPTGALGTALGGNDPSQFQIVAGSNGCQGVVLAANGTCTIAVVFSPTSGGAKTANLTVTGTPGGQAIANISGNGIAPAQFDFDIDSRDYGSVVTGTQSVIQTFTVTNIGGQTSGTPAAALNGVNASEFTITSNSCNTALTAAPAAGSSCSVSVRFDPVSVGAKVASLDVTGTPGGPVAAGLSGNGVAQAALAVNPTILNFPLVLIGDTTSGGSNQSFTVTNQGSVNTGNLTVTIIGANPGDFSQVNNCEDGAGPGVDFLIPGGQCTVTVTFAPTARDDRHASVQIQGTPGGTVTVALNGTSLPRLEILAPAPVTIPNNFNFGSQIVDPDAINTVTVTVRNNTVSPQTVTNTETDANNSFVPTAGCSATNVGAGATCSFQVGFDPQVLGANAGNYVLSIAGTATGCPAALPNCNTAQQNVNGTGTITTLAISDGDATPTVHNFGDTGIGTSSQVRVFTVSNLGDSPTGVLAVDLTGTGYQITANTCSGVILTDNLTCTIGVVFTPVGPGVSAGMITVRTSVGAPTLGGTVTATLSGNGVAANPIANPTMVDWGTLFAGEPTGTPTTDKVITISNPNDVNSTINLQLFDSSTPGTWFTPVNSAANTCGTWVGNTLTATLNNGATCNVVIRFTSLLPVGPRPNARLAVNIAVGNLNASVPLSANVRSTISISMPPTAFANQVVNTSSTQTVQVTNDSTQTVTVTAVNAGGAPYFIPTNGCNTLTGGATCTFQLQYFPTVAPQTNNTTLNVTATNGSATAAVTGNSITAANITASQLAYNFGSEVSGLTGSSRTFTFTNNGQQASTAFTVALSLATNFTITSNTCGAVLTGGASCTVTVQFTPTQTGVGLTANLNGVAATGGTPSVVLTGDGLAPGGLRVTPSSFVFANTTATGPFNSTQSFIVQNTSGATTHTLNIGLAGADPGSWTINGGGTTCGVNLTPGAMCTVSVTFTPPTAGQKSATLVIQTGTAFASLYGRALTVANVTANLGGVFSNFTTIDVPGVGTGPGVGAPDPSNITVTGIVGNVTSIRIALLTFSHTWPEDTDVLLQAPDGTRFIVMSDVGDLNGTDATNLNLIIEDQAAALFPQAVFGSGNFKPTNYSGLAPAADNFTGGGGLSPAPLGTATFASAFNGRVANGTWSLFTSDDFGGDSGDIFNGWQIEVNGTVFPNTAIGSTFGPRRFQLTNNGETAAATLTGVVGGADATHWQFADACNGVALAPGASCNLDVTFAPTTTGNKVANVTYSGPASIVVGVSGLAVNPAMLAVTPSVPQTDGSRPIGQNDTAVTTYTFSNLAGSATTTGIAFTLSDNLNFALSQANSTCDLSGAQTLAPGTSCTVGVLFNPKVKGALTTNVIATATAGGSVMGILNGTGTDALVRTAPVTVPFTFAAATPPNPGSTQTFTFQNQANVSTSLIQTTLTNMAGNEFSITNDTCGGQSLAGGQTCTIDVHFTPSGVAGNRTATLQIVGTVTGTTTSASATMQGMVN